MMSDGFFERYTDNARKALGLARQEAQRLNHEYIGTEHVLLGIVQSPGAGVEILQRFEATVEEVRAQIGKLVQSGGTTVTMGQLPFTPRIKKAMEYAEEEARRLGHNYVGTEHLLLGILREGDNVAVQVLLNFGLDLEKARLGVLELVGGDTREYETSPGGNECMRCSNPAQVHASYCPDHEPSEAEAILRAGLELIIKGAPILDGESAAHLGQLALDRALKASSRKPAPHE
jgi:ATP-dependent Clp protease ATP-binding subunit ClpA